VSGRNSLLRGQWGPSTAAQSCGCPIPGGTQGHGWALGSLSWWGHPAHSRSWNLVGFQVSSNPTILWFSNSHLKTISSFLLWHPFHSSFSHLHTSTLISSLSSPSHRPLGQVSTMRVSHPSALQPTSLTWLLRLWCAIPFWKKLHKFIYMAICNLSMNQSHSITFFTLSPTQNHNSSFNGITSAILFPLITPFGTLLLGAAVQ